MKILFLTEGNHPETIGGIQTFNRIMKNFFPEELITLTKKLKTKYERSYQIKDVFEIGSNKKIFISLNKRLKNKLFYYLFRNKIKAINPDICILNSPKELEYIKKLKSKKILVQHTNFNRYLKVYCNNDDKLIEKLKKELDCFVFLSEYDKMKFIEELNFPAEKTKVIRHSSEIEILNNQKIKNRDLIMISRIDNKTKRFDLAIKAMRKLPDFRLKIYGDGYRKDIDYLKELIERDKLENVFLCGKTNEVKEKLDDAGIFIMTSDCEGYGISNIEAMRRGLPIILRNTFEAAQDIIIKNNGILLNAIWNENEFIEAVNKIYENYDYYSKNSIECGRKYDFKVIKKQWEKLFETLLSNS